MVRWCVGVVVLLVAACGAPTSPPPAPPPPVVAFVSPGPLAASHTALACADCHVGTETMTSNNLCLGCHEHDGLRARINVGRGFHASAVVRGKACSVCHLDHRGAGFDPRGWKSVKGGERAFDHDLTGWNLDGAHAAVTCESCHVARNKSGLRVYMGTDRLCGACHKNQPHGFERKDMLACERCHTQTTWKPAKRVMQFDHGERRDAAMPVIGKHRDVACMACHPAGLFNSPAAKPAECAGCHATPHAGQIYAARPCDQCHSPFTFKGTLAFDHGERTKFGTGASHRSLACASCHTPKLGAKAPNTACETCHAARAPHKDRFKAFGSPPACGTCHAPNIAFDATQPAVRPTWKPNRFDHGKSAGWMLRMKHNTLTCRACHRGDGPTKFEKLAKGNDCLGCHEHAKVHPDDQGIPKFKNAQCTQCHFGM